MVTDAAPHSAHMQQIMAVFEQEGKPFAVSIGSLADNSYSIYSDYYFFIEDPHELYKHWPPDVWQAIDQHQAKPGMNELQVDFALGMGVLDHASDSDGEDRALFQRRPAGDGHLSRWQSCGDSEAGSDWQSVSAFSGYSVMVDHCPPTTVSLH